MSKHVCIDAFHEPTTLAFCNNHPKWSVARNIYGSRWLVYVALENWPAATFATWAEAFAYAYDHASAER